VAFSALFIMDVTLKIIKMESQVQVAHACNHSYSGVRDEEDHGLKPVRQIVCKILS
jgi:hypothetical protein